MSETGKHLVFVGPYGSGKTSLMIEVASPADSPYWILKNMTDRGKRPGEGDDELVFASRALFDIRRPDFLTTHSTADYRYGVPRPLALPGRVSMRALPSNLDYVRQFVDRTHEAGLGRVVVCQIAVPDMEVIAGRLRARDPSIALDDLAARLESNMNQPDIAAAFSDSLTFMNDYPTLAAAGLALREQLDAHLFGSPTA